MDLAYLPHAIIGNHEHCMNKALFFSVGNLGCGMGECGKGRNEWVMVDKSDIFF